MKISTAWKGNVTSPSVRVLTFSIFFGVIILIGFISSQGAKEFPIVSSAKKEIMSEALENKKIAIIIAFKDFRDEEYFIPKESFEKSGVEVKTVSTQKGIAFGSQGGEVEINITMGELDVINFDAIIFVGGPGALKELDNEQSYSIAKEVILRGKVLAAICISPVILANSGVLSGKRATVWSSPLDKDAVKILEVNNVVYDAGPVVVDGNIVTADGPDSARKFAEAVINLLRE